MEPRIKLYGLFTVTKKRYLSQWALALLLLAAALFVWTMRPQLDFSSRANRLAGKTGVPAFEFDAQRPRTPELPPHIIQLLNIIDLIPWVVAGLGLLLALECFLVMRKFAVKEAADKAVEQAAAEPKPAGEAAQTAEPESRPAPSGGAGTTSE